MNDSSDRTPTLDDEIDAKYESGKNQLIQEFERIKLPWLADTIRYNPSYMRISTDSQSDWDGVKQSRLIESFIINLPVSPIVLYERDKGAYEVIDGSQRLKAVADFYSNKLTLSGLEVNTELNGCTYITLPRKVQAVLDRRYLPSITIIPKSDFSPDEIARLVEVVSERLNKKNQKHSKELT